MSVGALGSIEAAPSRHRASARYDGALMCGIFPLGRIWEEQVPVSGAVAACSVVFSFLNKSVAEERARNVYGWLCRVKHCHVIDVGEAAVTLSN